MFYRSWAGLPKDPAFPSDLNELGYFIHGSDEIRSIKNEKEYFKFFITRNARYNDRQRFAMNEAIGKVVHQRLEQLGLEKTLLPLGTTDTSQPHVPIFVSADIKSKSRIIVIVGETCQDLGVLAHRIIGGPGGIDRGSMVSVVRTLQQQPSSPDDDAAPGFILANTGQLVWMPALRRTLTMVGALGAPMPSAVHAGAREDEDGVLDRVPGNRDACDHLRTIFEEVIPALASADASLDVVAVGDGADALERYLDWSVTWNRLSGRINSLAIVGGYHDMDELKCQGFRQFMREKTRGYATSAEPLGTPLSGPDGNPGTTAFTELGCPLFSGGETHFVEALLPACLPHLVDWLAEVVAAGRGRYTNPPMTVVHVDPSLSDDEDDKGGSADDVASMPKRDAPPHEQPPVDGSVNLSADIANDEGNKKEEKEKLPKECGSEEEREVEDLKQLQRELGDVELTD